MENKPKVLAREKKEFLFLSSENICMKAKDPFTGICALNSIIYEKEKERERERERRRDKMERKTKREMV
jgi:hypothetical protein